jgi:RNA polymerase sigma-70 factor (ECF subfamily)
MPAPNWALRLGVEHAPDSTRSGLLDAAKRLDAEAWQELVECYSWLVFQWCRNGGLNAQDAADVVQTVMAQVAACLPNFQKDGKKAAFRRWLRTITRRRVADFWRAEARQPRGEGGSSALQRFLSVPDDPESSSSSGFAECHLLHQRLWGLIECLEDEFDEHTWQAFWLTTIERHTSGEAGARLGMTANAVRLAKGRVLQRLRSAMAMALPDNARLRSIIDTVPKHLDSG